MLKKEDVVHDKNLYDYKFDIPKFRDGRFIRYRFFHLYCLGKSRKSEVCTWVEEEEKKRLNVTTQNIS